MISPAQAHRGARHVEELLEFLIADFDSGGEENNTLDLAGFASDLGFGVDEVSLAPGDSGGPLFIGGAIAGVNIYAAQPIFGDVNNLADSSWGELSISLRVSRYREFILAATDGAAIFVPEPTRGYLALAWTIMGMNVKPLRFVRQV